MTRLPLHALLALALSACAIVVDDDEIPWTSVGGVVVETGEEMPSVTACRNALDDRYVALVGGHVDCSYPYYPLCFGGDFAEPPAGSVCCDGYEPGADCEVHESKYTPNGPMPDPCEDVHICDY
jgi:hypothetical protein